MLRAIDVEEQRRPHHECKHIDCDNYIYAPDPNEQDKAIQKYQCDACAEVYVVRRARWPRRDVSFIIA